MSILDDVSLVDDMAEKCAAELLGTNPSAWAETIYGFMVRLVEQAWPAAHAAGAAAENARVVAVIEERLKIAEADCKAQNLGHDELVQYPAERELLRELLKDVQP